MKTLKRRRKENKTDYLKRIKLLKSGTPRVIFRRTNRYVAVQYITSKQSQDKIKFGITSKKLIEYGWPEEFKGSLKSIPASYLLGLLAGKRITKEKLETPIVDSGMFRMIHKNRIYSFLKGLIDSGIEIKCKEETFPSKDKINGKNLKRDFSKTFLEIKSKIEKS